MFKFVYECSDNCYQFLPQIYSNKHIKLEWYNLNQRDIDDIKEYIFDRDCV
jgi:hypothetical protein